MPRWLLPTGAGIAAFVGATFLLTELAQSIGIRLLHDESYFDAYDNFREGGLTRAGFLGGFLMFLAAGWTAGAVNTRRIDCGLPAKEWHSIAALFGAFTAYVAIMHLLTVTFRRTTDAIPDFLFNILDLGILVGVGYLAFRAYSRRTQ